MSGLHEPTPFVVDDGENGRNVTRKVTRTGTTQRLLAFNRKPRTESITDDSDNARRVRTLMQFKHPQHSLSEVPSRTQSSTNLQLQLTRQVQEPSRQLPHQQMDVPVTTSHDNLARPSSKLDRKPQLKSASSRRSTVNLTINIPATYTDETKMEPHSSLRACYNPPCPSLFNPVKARQPEE